MVSVRFPAGPVRCWCESRAGRGAGEHGRECPLADVRRELPADVVELLEALRAVLDVPRAAPGAEARGRRNVLLDARVTCAHAGVAGLLDALGRGYGSPSVAAESLREWLVELPVTYRVLESPHTA